MECSKVSFRVMEYCCGNLGMLDEIHYKVKCSTRVASWGTVYYIGCLNAASFGNNINHISFVLSNPLLFQ